MVQSRIPEGQLELGFSQWFKAREESPPGNQVDLDAGVFFNPGDKTPYIMAAQTSAAFVPVTLGFFRYDLVYLDENGVVGIQAGNEQALPVNPYDGAPGDALGPAISEDHFPVAYVLVDEAVPGPALIYDADITDLRAGMSLREGGVVGDLATDDSTGAGGILGTIWKKAPIDHRHPPNVDGVNPSDTELSTTSPGVSNIYSRRDHTHQMSAAALSALATPQAKSTTCHWTPYDNQAAGNPGILKWVLHAFQARATNNSSFWFNVTGGAEEVLTLWPVDGGGTALNVGPGFADDTDALRATFPNSWLYVYLIGAPNTGAVALVYSTNPPTVGPLILSGPFTGGADVYTVWSWVTCLEGVLDGAGANPIPVPMRKYDNVVVKEMYTGRQVGGHVEDLFWNVTMPTANVSFAEHVSPMSMCVFLNFMCHVQYIGALQEGRVDWQFALPAGTSMGQQDEIQFANNDELKQIQWPNGGHLGGFFQEFQDSMWVNLDAARQLAMDITIYEANDYAWVKVVAYKEFSFEEAASINWSP
jgi:hypothetical protein